MNLKIIPFELLVLGKSPLPFDNKCKKMIQTNRQPNRYPYKIAGMVFTNKKYYCSSCKEEVKGFKDRLSTKEFRFSGLCQECQDIVFTGEEEWKIKTCHGLVYVQLVIKKCIGEIIAWFE